MADPLIAASRQLQARDMAIMDAIEDGNFNKADYPDSDDIWSGKASWPSKKQPDGQTKPAASASTSRGTKRKSTDHAQPEPADVNLDDIEVPDGIPMDSCNVVRGKIRRFLEAGGMKIGEFCDAIGVSGNAYRRFMAQSGNDKGMYCDTYTNAFEFFKKREMAGLKMPKKQKTTSASSAADSAQDISGVQLEGEENDDVQVFDSCDEIRRKITAYLRKPGVTQAQFCRDLLAQYHTHKRPASVQTSQLTRFRGHKGADAGNTSCVFYAAYVFFEKLRIKENKPKTKHRQEMESIWGSTGGFSVTAGHHKGYYCVGDERPFRDQYGRVSFHKVQSIP